jgi:hypothetical protein
MHLDEVGDRVHDDLMADIGTVLQPEVKVIHDVGPWQGVAHCNCGRYDLSVLREVHEVAAIATSADIQSDAISHNIGGKTSNEYLAYGPAVKTI